MVNALFRVVFFEVSYYRNFANGDFLDKIIEPCKFRMKYEQVQSNE